MRRKNAQPVDLTERTYLVQRLTLPWNSTTGAGLLGSVDNPFSFGGGYKNGGLSDTAMSMLRPCFGFDYMGSAEYEFGAVPEALTKVAKQADDGTLAAWTFEVDLATTHRGWGNSAKDATGMVTVYALGYQSAKDSITARIQWIATEGQDNKTDWGYGRGPVQFKEMARFGATLRGDEYTDRNGGWLELNNGFLFFSDEQMWARTSAVFGVETGVEIEAPKA